MSDAKLLRDALIDNARNYAEAQNIQSAHMYRSRGKVPVTLFREHDHKGARRHYNFNRESYAAILANGDWARRLLKPHNAKSALSPGDREGALELDSCCSSDALLMNIFCHPSAQTISAIRKSFRLDEAPKIIFGYKPHLPFHRGKRESRSSEIDLMLCTKRRTLVCEAKLTEKDFTSKDKSKVERYRDLETVFDVAKLPQTNRRFLQYQLIRNFLAAFHLRADFALICDERRSDLKQAFDAVRAAMLPGTNLRSSLVTWQQIAAHLPADLQVFLRENTAFSDGGIMAEPDTSILSDQFRTEVRGLKHKNVAAETLIKLLGDEIKVRSDWELGLELTIDTQTSYRFSFTVLRCAFFGRTKLGGRQSRC